ncbi:hypothetical protein L210DRAFT_3649069 [Boletus edulis BED1]|uniref:ubiquitinyl hydrolase 1 n=1 Tax=Boletus edulis BED1 TaxID=1328754 RepID=A0AAD4BM63_BOLED|nr:hypothetical protein L210DRAFT_3649069 [Boletus edulis BED1]
MFSSVFDDSPSGGRSSLEYVVNHVFFPVYHPENDDHSPKNVYALACVVHAAALAYNEHIDDVHKPHWLSITKMLGKLKVFISTTLTIKHMGSDGVIDKKELARVRIASQLGGMKAGDTLVFPIPHYRAFIFRKQDRCTLYESLHFRQGGRTGYSLPDLAIEIPAQSFDDEDFRYQLAGFLCGTSQELPTDMLLGHAVEPKRITKHYSSAHIVKRTRSRKVDDSPRWSRSDLWFFIRAAIQSSLDRSLGRGAYKAFILFFMYNLANHAVNSSLPDFLYQSMSGKILRRFEKFDASVPEWLSHAVLHTCTYLSHAVDRGWQKLWATQHSSSPWKPSQLDLIKDIQHPLLHVDDCISTSLANRDIDPPRNISFPNTRLQGTLTHFLSRPKLLVAVPHDDVPIILHDFARAVREEIDDWVACVTNVNKACDQLDNLVAQYLSFASHHVGGVYDPDHLSVMLLTTVELWVALDKLVIKEIPILADYSPEVPTYLLGSLLLRDDVSIHRLHRAYQYLSARHIRAHSRWSALSSEFTEQSFPCRYYDSSPHFQHLKASIEYILPTEPLYAKVVLFELQCPVSFDAWRSVTCRISRPQEDPDQADRDIPVFQIRALIPHIQVIRSPSLTLFSSPSAPRHWDRLYYLYGGSSLRCFGPVYRLPSGPYADSGMQRYLGETTHTSNEVLAAQGNCHSDLSLQEFIAFAHLRSGGSLQWFNILQELRRRTLDFHRQEIYLLLAQASAEVGPVGSDGELWWHQELQDGSFCHALLGELESLFLDVSVGPSDGPAMAVISLLAGKLVSKPSGDVSASATKLLQKVRRKTFDWVRELLYNVGISPANKEILKLLWDMAAVCRSTFDVGSAESHKLLCSAQDIEIALSCIPTYSQVLLNRDCRLSLVLEGSLRNAIEADASDIGVDRAVQMVWPGYRPSPCRWKALESPNSQWLVCETAPTNRDKHSQSVHINLLNGALLVDGRPIGIELPSAVTSDKGYQSLFGIRNMATVASDLPGMDFVTMSVVSKHHVHFAVRNAEQRVVIRAQSKDTDDIFELIPHGKLLDCRSLPPSIIRGHVHWLNLSTSSIEIRPIEEPWEQSPDNWIIHLQPSGNFHVTKGGESLVDSQSPTWGMVSSHFLCLDDPENLIITSPVDTTTQSPQLSITLPRYGLSFFINKDNDLESRDFKDMVYDEDQCIGTLFGLANRLVLRPKVQFETGLIPKHILIPHGDSLDQRGHNVYVKLPSSGPVRYYTYQEDRELGCLKGIVDFESGLYLARLHALTSSVCRPEPLTGRTGVEEAISLIRLADAPQRTHGILCSDSHRPKINFESTTLRIWGHIYNQSEHPTEHALLQGAYLCPFTASVRPPWKKPLKTLDQLLLERPPPKLRARNQLPHHIPRNPGYHDLSTSPDIEPLRQLFSSLQRTNGTVPPFQSQYISRLHSSAHDLKTMNSIGVTRGEGCRKPSTETLRNYYAECRINYTDSLNILKETLCPKTEFERIFGLFGQWPRVTPFILFRCLASTSPFKLSESWKKCLISLALLALDVQRARRLLRFSRDNLEEEFYKELANEGCDGWDPAENPDWLLIQLQGDFLIRRVQADVAKEIISPLSAKNSVMQVNMGEGKTSVIIPICAAALADGNQLVRVMVPKALLPQTLQLLSDRLSGLVNKPVYHMTFFRNDAFATGVDLEHVYKFMSKCMDERGIVVMQPEDVLSIKLACVETRLLRYGIGSNPTPVMQKRGFEYVLHALTDWSSESLNQNTYVSALIGEVKQWHREPGTLENSRQAKGDEFIRHRQGDALMGIQRFLEAHARDILDESDDILRPQFQLIYATGYQHCFEGAPDRWLIAQQVLRLVQRHAHLLSTSDSYAMRCDGGSLGSFPHIHILQAEGGQKMMSLITQDILDGRLSTLSFHPELGLRGAIREFILNKDIHPDTVMVVEKYARQSTSWGSLLLLRGLLAHNILLFSLTQRRWRVDYGLDKISPPRTMLAIPYRAKDVPAKSAEFGHPDITILLTCLSYYYGGLNEDQLRDSFQLLLHQDDPSSEYALWLEDCGTAPVPDPLRRLSGVNIKSLEQWVKHFVPLFSRNKRAVDLYLSNVVFAKHANEFPQRISGSNWDIAERKNHLVTGLLGTNDGQYLLPTSIVQNDPSHLHQTGANARVLAYLLRPENSLYMVTTDKFGERWTTLKLLSTVVSQKPPIRVLLDVGAQILDFSNIQLAKTWLDCIPATEVAAAIYFDENDELMVLTRNGTTQPLSSSSFIHQLHRCVVYLDDAHTKGTDIKFPRGFRAAVTLGHMVTKDRLVQGCMRMRKLGHGHSVLFFAPHEVDQRIRGLAAKKDQSTPVATSDILHWAIHETWSDIQRQAPYWAQQGMAHQSRYEAWSRFCQQKASPEELANVWVQPELKSLADMYMPCHSPDATTFTRFSRQIHERCEALGILSLRDVHMDEEQEREVSREIEREREVDLKPSWVVPVKHSIHPDVVTFVRTGDIPSPLSSTAFRHVFSAGATASSGLHAWSPYILATADFCETIKENETVQGRMTDYLRPVQWVLSGRIHGRVALVLLSPFEADFLMPNIQISEHVHLHLYTPRTTKRIQPSDDLRLYSVPPVPPDWIPPWTLIDQLNLFAGQLYPSDFTSYVRLSRFLGVHTEDLPQDAGTAVSCNWFSNPNSSIAEIKDRFKGTPLPLALLLLAVRRGMDFSGTHMGRILDGLPLTEEDFQSPPDIVKAVTTSCSAKQDRHRVPAEVTTTNDGDEQGSTMTRKRVSDFESLDHQSKRRRLNCA